MKKLDPRRLLAPLLVLLGVFLVLAESASGKIELRSEITDSGIFLSGPSRVGQIAQTSLNPRLANRASPTNHASDLSDWLSREPLGEGESLNLYAYCHGDPVNKVDRLGLDSVPVAPTGFNGGQSVYFATEKKGNGILGLFGGGDVFDSESNRFYVGKRDYEAHTLWLPTVGDTVYLAKEFGGGSVKMSELKALAASGDISLNGTSSSKNLTKTRLKVALEELSGGPNKFTSINPVKEVIAGSFDAGFNMTRDTMNFFGTPFSEGPMFDADSVRVRSWFAPEFSSEVNPNSWIYIQSGNTTEAASYLYGGYQLTRVGVKSFDNYFDSKKTVNTRDFLFADNGRTTDEFVSLLDSIRRDGLNDNVINYVQIDGVKYIVNGNDRLRIMEKILGDTDGLIFNEVKIPFRGYTKPDHVIWSAMDIRDNLNRGAK